MKSKPSGSKKKDAEDMLSVRIGKDVKDRLHAEVAARRDAQETGRAVGAPVTVTDIVKDAIEARDHRRVWEEVFPAALDRMAQRMDDSCLELEAQRVTMEVLVGWAVSPEQANAVRAELRACTRAIKKIGIDIEILRTEVRAMKLAPASEYPPIVHFGSAFCVALVGGVFVLTGMAGWLGLLGVAL